MGSVIADIRYGFRMLLKSPGFTVVAIVALALGIGANSAIFSVINGVLLRPLPYSDPDRLVAFREMKLPEIPDFSVSPANSLDWQSQNTTFDGIEASQEVALNFTGRGDPVRLSGARVGVGTLKLLGVQPALGRDFHPDEGEPGHDDVVIISQAFWQQKFGGDQNCIGQTIDLNNRPYTIIGVMPAGFRYPGRTTEVLVPLALDEQSRTYHGNHSFAAIGRVKNGVTLDQARADLNTIATRLEEKYPDTNIGWRPRIEPYLDFQVGQMRRVLWVLLGAVGMVLLIACVNIANLLLARASVRQREIAIRNAVGAGRWRIMRQLLTESILLSAMGGFAGLLLASWGLDILLALVPKDLPRVRDVSLDGRAIGYTLLITLATGIVFGIVPALHASRPNLTEALKDTGRGVTGGPSMMRNMLVIIEVALALTLLVGAGLMIKSFLKLTNTDPGFDSKNVLVAGIILPDRKYNSNDKQLAFFRQLAQQTSTLPGVTAVGITHSLPIISDLVNEFHIEGEPLPEPGQGHTTNSYTVSPGYFKAMGIRLIRGRIFTDSDVKGATRVAIINEAMAKRYFPKDDPVGKRISRNSNDDYREIVGVVADVKQYGLAADTPMQFYDPYEQQPFSTVAVVVKTTGDPTAISAQLRSQVLQIDKDQPISNITTMENILAGSIASQRFLVMLLSIFAGLALVLAAVGIYGVMAYSVTQRTTEMGLRMALGAQKSDVLKLIVAQGMALTVIGLVIGIAASYFMTYLISNQLYGVSATDPVTFLEIALVLSLVSFVANLIPASRATRVDPMVALRSE